MRVGKTEIRGNQEGSELDPEVDDRQWRRKESKWGHAPWGECLEGATAHFLQSF